MAGVAEQWRELMESSWQASCRRAETGTAMLVLSPASFAGLVVGLADNGSVSQARAMVPRPRGVGGFWLEVHIRLDAIEIEDRRRATAMAPVQKAG